MRSFGIAALLLLGGCGYIGPPLPPARAIPQRIADLTAIEYGDHIDVTFTIPALDTDGVPLTALKLVRVYAGTNSPPYTPETWAATAKPYEVSVTTPGPVMFDQIPVSDWAGKTISVGALVTGPKGRTSGWSNLVSFEVGPVLAPPANLMAQNVKDGVSLRWRGTAAKYRVLRSTAGGALQPVADTTMPEYLDTSAQIGTAYQYRVLALVNDMYMSTASEPLAMPITPQDVFPPAVPTGVTAIAGVNSIQVSWDANTEADFRGYNVFRSIDGGPFMQVASLLESPEYNDMMVEAGKSYQYAISSVDLLNNQSARSEPVSARLP